MATKFGKEVFLTEGGSFYRTLQELLDDEGGRYPDPVARYTLSETGKVEQSFVPNKSRAKKSK